MSAMHNEPTPHSKRGFMPAKLKQFEEAIDELRDTLAKAKSPLTVKQLCKKLKCSKQAVYFRLEALKGKVPLRITKVREGEHGPFSKAYSLIH